MRTLILISLIAVLLMTSCNNKQKKQIEQTRLDSIARIEKRNQEIKDSLEQIRIDSLALIAWGDAKFGMSLKEVLSTNAFKGSDVYGNNISMKYDNRQIANTKMSIGTFWANFKMNELYRIDIQTYNQTANYIDDLENDALLIASQFEKKYGKPTYFLGRNISITDFNEDEEFLFYKWEIGNKTIYIQFGEVYNGSEYYYRIAILNSGFPTKSDPEEKKEQEQKAKETAEKEKYQF